MAAMEDFFLHKHKNSALPVFTVHVTAEDSQRQECGGTVRAVVLLQEPGDVQAEVVCSWEVVWVGADPSNYLQKRE